MTDSTTTSQGPSGLPSESTFSFKAPFPISAAGVSALKHRRVSLASPSSPRLVQPYSFRDEMGLHANAPTSGPEKKGKMRKIDLSLPADDEPAPIPEKKPRKKWTAEETDMLVQGCRLHGVGNWKTILQDTTLSFHDRSAVDLKDRFRTYFPDAYKIHYPNARTHLSSKIRSTLSDGTSLFEKTRSKRRRPFTEAEDRALKAGYEKHGTTWATIVKDPIFQEAGRRSTDLRDRFRNAFPDLYQAAGYKPRTATKKKVDTPLRAADDQLSVMTSAGPVRSRRRAQTTQGLFRGGTKSVPQSTAVSEDEDSSAAEEEDSETSAIFKTPPIPVFVDNVSTAPFSSNRKTPGSSPRDAFRMNAESTLNSAIDNDDEEMQLINPDNTDALQIPDFLPNHTHADMETWSAGLSTPTHSSTAAWSTAGASPTSSHIESTSSDFLMGATHGHHGHGHSHSLSASAASSPFIHRRGAESVGGTNNNFMIGKSAWGEDWFSSNPRLDSRNSGNSSDAGANVASAADRFSPPSPWGFNHAHLHGGVLDRYDLFPPYMPDANGFVDEMAFGSGMGGFGAGMGMGNGSAGPSAGGTGFKGYHSQIAGDLISGASSNTGGRFGSGPAAAASLFTSASFGSGAALSMSLSSLAGMYSSSFSGSSPGFGTGADGVGNSELEGGISGLGLEGIAQSTGIHPMQLHAHASNLGPIDELGLTGISLDDHDHCDPSGRRADGACGSDDKDAMETADERGMGPFGSGSGARSPAKHAHTHTPKGKMKEEPDLEGAVFGLEDLVDLGELHATPPATPLVAHPRPMRRPAADILGGHGFDGGGAAGMQHPARSISVPPGEARNGGAQLGVPMSIDDVGLHMHHGHVNFGFFNQLSGNGHVQHHSQQHQQQQQQQQHQDQQTQTQQHAHLQDHRNASPMRMSMSGTSAASLHSPISPGPQQQRHSTNASQLTPIFPTHLILSPPSSVGLSSPPSSSGHPPSSPHVLAGHTDDLWRAAFPAAALAGVDYSYNLPFLDLHYYGHAAYGAGIAPMGGHAAHAHNSLGLDMLDEHAELASSARQGQAALDLAQSAALASMGGGAPGSGLGLGLGLGFPLRAFDTPSPAGTIRHHAHAGRQQKPNAADVFAAVPQQGAGGSASGMQLGGGARDAGGGRPGFGAAGTIRQKSNPGPSGVGRSMSHHRGQSAVCPQDLVLRNENNKRKRASWDGGAV